MPARVEALEALKKVFASLQAQIFTVEILQLSTT